MIRLRHQFTRALAGLILAALLIAPAAAERLRVAVTALPPSWGNPFMADGTPSSYVWSALFDGLTRLNPEGEVVPALAASWQQLDPHHWRFDLRQDVRFSNGEAFDAEAVAATLRWLQSPEGRVTVIGSRVQHFRLIEVVGPHTLIIGTTTPDGTLPKRMTAILMVAPKAWAELGATGFASEPSGTGPFRLVTWGERKRRAILEANPYAWRKPVVEGIEFIELAETAARVQALISGDADLAKVGVDDIDILHARGLKTVVRPSMQVMSIAFRTEREEQVPLQDIRVRQALNYAVDKAPLAAILLRGYAAVAGQPASKVTYGYNPDVTPYPYDPVKARALLAEAGYPDGFPLKIEMVVDSLPADTLIYQSVASDLRKVGVRAEIRAIPFPSFLRNYVSGKWKSDAFGISWTSAPYNDVIRPMENFSCLKRNPFFCEEDLVPLLKAGGELPEPERKDVLMQLAVEYHERAPALFLVEQLDFFAHRGEITDVQLSNRTPDYELIRPAVKP